MLFYHAGEVIFPVKGGDARIEVAGDLSDGDFCFTVHADRAFALTLRIPEWSVAANVTVCGEDLPAEGGFVTIKRTWREGDQVTLSLRPLLRGESKNGKLALSYGPFVLARDQGKESFFAPRRIAFDGEPTYRKLCPENGERIRLEVPTRCGKMLLTDYASCGKHWTKRRSRVTVWQKTK